jgi:hypothetical protein
MSLLKYDFMFSFSATSIDYLTKENNNIRLIQAEDDSLFTQLLLTIVISHYFNVGDRLTVGTEGI